MRTGMKRLFAAFAAGMLLFSTAFAQEDQELTEEDLFAQWDLEADETENVMLDENGEEHQVLSDAELAELDTLEDRARWSLMNPSWRSTKTCPTTW